ncbi:MAG: transcriptional regulator [Lachnospiraceae bacterium]|nr:transcriptional regulator [Lachnospiraceae bacterium]
MRSSYEDFLRRLNQYRQSLNMTQEETSHALGITQSQFSKMELGKTIMPYKSLKLLIGMGWDVDYLVTGKESARNISGLRNVVMRVEEENRIKLLDTVVWLLKQGLDKSASDWDFETKCEIEILKMKANGGSSDSVLYKIRKISGMAQIPMAEKLGVNIKKYRMLEKNEVNPDAELLFRIYEVTGCKPSLLINYDNVENVIIDDLWNQIALPVQRQILFLREQLLWFVRM